MAQLDIQSKAKAYLQKHQIEEILGDLVTTLSHHQIKNPIIYMIKYLATVHCNQKELQEAGIQIDLKEKLEQPILCLTYPKEGSIPGLQKKLTKEIFYAIKNKITDQGNTFRNICKLLYDKENSKSKTILYAVDPSSYQTFDQIFEPVVREKCEKNLITPLTKDLSYNLTSTILDDVKPYLEESIFVLRRNVPKQRFGSTLQNRAALTKELCSALSKQQIINYSLQYDLTQLAQEDVRRLQINDKLFKKKDPTQSNINQIFKGLRHPDWPLDRMVLQSSDKQNIVWINREDHLKFKFLSTEKSSIIDAIDTCCKMNQFLDNQNLASFDDKYGFHTVKPQFSGLGLTFTLKFKLDSQSISKIKTNSNALNQRIQNRVLNIQTKEKDKHFIIKAERCTGLTMKQYVEQLCTMLTILFEGIIKKSEQVNIEKYFGPEQIKENQQQLLSPIKNKVEQHMKSPVKSPSHVAIDILQTEELDFYTYHKSRLDSQKKTDLSNIVQLQELVLQLQVDSLYYPENLKRFLLIRRNLSLRKRNLEELIKLDAQELSDQQKRKILKEYNLQESGDYRIFSIKMNTLEYFLIINLDDDLIFVFPITYISLSQQLHKIQKIVDSFITNEYKYAWNPQIGYLTHGNEHLGSGISIITTFPEDSNKDIQKLLKQAGQNQILQVVNNSLILHSLNKDNVQNYKTELNVLFVKIKEQHNQNQNQKKFIHNEIGLIDCYKNNQLWAPTQECFKELNDLYTKYIEKAAIALFYEQKMAPRKNYAKIQLNELQENLPSNSSIKEIKCSFFRNFENVRYLHEMTFAQKKNFKTTYYKLRQYEGLKFGKNHHIELTFVCNPQDFIQKFTHNWNLLIEIGREFQFQRDEHFGYLGPILNQSLLEGFQLEIQFIKPMSLDKIRGYEPIHQNDELQQADEVFRVISNRPCLIDFEVHLMKQIM